MAKKPKLQKKKLLIVTGAGASIEFGMPSVSNCDMLFEKWALSLLPLELDRTKSLYTFIKNNIQHYYSFSKGKHTNFEELLYIINVLSAIYNDNQYHEYPLNAILNPKTLPRVVLNGTTKNADGNDLTMLHSNLVDKLLNEFRVQCNNLNSTKNTELAILKKFIQDLKNEFEIAVVTVNYDDILLQADATLETGFNSSGVFNSNNVINNSWGFCYHLHGSVHFDMQGGASSLLHEIKWQNNLANVFQQNSSGRNRIATMEGLNLLTSTIIAGYDKSNQIQRYPFLTYYCQLEKIIQEADSYLICGYGFSDFHLNNQLSAIRDSNGSNKKIVVLDWANDNQDPLQFRSDDWAINLQRTLTADVSAMGTRRYGVAPQISDLKKNNEFEYCRNPKFPLSVWYNGLLEACKNSSKVISELK